VTRSAGRRVCAHDSALPTVEGIDVEIGAPEPIVEIRLEAAHSIAPAAVLRAGAGDALTVDALISGWAGPVAASAVGLVLVQVDAAVAAQMAADRLAVESPRNR
jgi:hypothetical protein